MSELTYHSVQDWFFSVLVSYPAPWSIAPLEGKYYGTRILDARGVCILSVLRPFGKPSARELDGRTEEQWYDPAMSVHWESQTALSIAEAIVESRNHIGSWEDGSSSAPIYVSEEVGPELCRLVFEYCQWEEPDRMREVCCGGPNRERERRSDDD